MCVCVCVFVGYGNSALKSRNSNADFFRSVHNSHHHHHHHLHHHRHPNSTDFSLSLSLSLSRFPSVYIIHVRYTIIPEIGRGLRVFANGPEDLGSIPVRVIPKTQKMVLDASLLNTQHYKVRIKGKVEQSREGVAPFPTPIEKGAFGLPSTMVANFTYFTYIIHRRHQVFQTTSCVHTELM